MSPDISYESLRDIYEEERKYKRLTRLPPAFYPNTRKALDSDPSLGDRERRMMAKMFREITAIRSRKLCLLALSAVTVGAKDTERLPPEEEDVYRQMRRLLQEHYEGLNGISKEPPAKKAEDAQVERPVEDHPSSTTSPVPDPTPEPEPASDDPVSRPGNAAEAEDGEPSGDVLVRALSDINPFALNERIYEIKKDDVLTLDRKAADLLSKAGKITVLDVDMEG